MNNGYVDIRLPINMAVDILISELSKYAVMKISIDDKTSIVLMRVQNPFSKDTVEVEQIMIENDHDNEYIFNISDIFDIDNSEVGMITTLKQSIFDSLKKVKNRETVDIDFIQSNYILTDLNNLFDKATVVKKVTLPADIVKITEV